MTLLTDEQATPIALAPSRHVVPLRKQSQALQHASYRGSRFSRPSNNYLRRRNSIERERMPRPSFAEEDTDYGCDYFSDGNSEVFTDFTSVSQQRKKRVLRHSRKQSSNNYYRRQMSPSFVSTSFSNASMAIDEIEIQFDLSKGRLGLKIMVTEENNGFCILIAEIEPNSLAARDKRIKPDMIIVAVNGRGLGYYTKDDAVEMLRQACTTGARYVTFTFAQTEREKFTPRDDTVLPIDTSAWVKQTMQQLPAINEECRLKMVYNPCCLNAGGFPSSGVGSSVCDSDSSFPANPNLTQLYQLQPKRFNVQSKMDIAVSMFLPGGLELKHKTNGKKTFASTEMVDWLRSNVHGLEEAEKCHKFANKLVEDGLIALAIDNKQFVVKTEGYYYFTDKLQTSCLSKASNG
uniref:PDZ domain-containing protein n=1 Tax=Panagrolaimus davidi TaxID=227884 RepID=A0A914P128_9BILA